MCVGPMLIFFTMNASLCSRVLSAVLQIVCSALLRCFSG